MAVIPINNDLKIQSPFLWCGAVGSDGSDDTYAGIHLRWDLMKDLGYNHIPKGTKGEPGSGYNQNNDFINLYRTEFSTKLGENVIDFADLDENNVTYLPDDEGLIYHYIGSNFENFIIVRFLDRAKFRYILHTGLDINDPIQDFLNRYDGIIEVEIQDKLMYNFELKFIATQGSDTAFFETVMTTDRSDTEAVKVIKREYKDSGTLISEGVKSTSENIRFFRVKQYLMHTPKLFMFNTYEDLFTDVQNEGEWKEMGQFSLELEDDEKVFSWFQGQTYTGGSLTLDWPKYNDGTMLMPDNYMDRWLYPDDGLKAVVGQYIELSNTDPRANINYDTGDPEDPNSITVSLLDMLKMVSLDYHAARMLGLGFLDNDLSEDPSGHYLYAAVYSTEHNLPGWENKSDNVFITLPTSMADFRSPLAPELDLTYGLFVETDENNAPVLISDPNGYSFHDDSRYINLTKINLSAPQDIMPDIPVADNFDATIITQPSSYGIKYKEVNEGDWRMPGLLFDDEYTDINGVYETTTIPEQDSNPIYTHREIESGVHTYALYSVNIFSRVSELSNYAITDNTTFPVRNTLLPPNNLAAQYIQEESPLIFTTQAEQVALAEWEISNPGQDNCKTRVTFEWSNLHNNAFQFADIVEFYFREQPVDKVEGMVKSVTSLSDTECEVRTKPYSMTSSNPATTVTPYIAPGDETRFIGSNFNTADGQFVIYHVGQPSQQGDGPTFFLKKNERRETVQIAPDEPMVIVPVYSMPDVNSIFFTFENAGDLSQWSKLSQTVEIVNFSTTTEMVYEEDGSSNLETVGGINGIADIIEIPDSDGGYLIYFTNGNNLNPHPDPRVSWSKGVARIFLNNFPNRKKRLQVYSIQETSPIKLVVFDPTYLSEPGQRIQTGSQVVNFHPSYRVYLDAETGVFDRTILMPAGNNNNKKTYLAATSVDFATGFSSAITSPATILARNIQTPLPPNDFYVQLNTSRPDFFDKSSFTIDLQFNTFNRVPYGFVVYRASEMAILQVLYKPETVQSVWESLESLEEYGYENRWRWQGLINAEIDPEDDNKFFQWGEFRFPNPDNESTYYYTDADTAIYPFPLTGSLQQNVQLIKRIIEDIFVSVTETPVVIEYLKTANKTSSELPKVRDIIGRLLAPTDLAFNPFPMAVNYPADNPEYVRFTDYTLDGNASSAYFYFAREISVNMKLSERTQVTWPVALSNAKAPAAPKIRKVISKEGDPAFFSGPSVIFELNEYLNAEKIENYLLYRTLDISKTASVTQMKLANEFYHTDPIIDQFSDLEFPPFGESIFYRIVAKRWIENEAGMNETVHSHASELIMTSILDVYYPIAPELTVQIGNTNTDVNGNIVSLENVSFSWPATTHNATYSLFKMNSRGQWQLLWSQKSNESQSFPPDSDFVNYPATAMLDKLDDNGNVIYHRFKITVENASGLFNKEDSEVVL